jgi:hypothetical protein
MMSGCQKKCSSCAVLEIPATTRPIVGVVPVIDHSHSDLNWDVSQELSTALRQRLAQKNRLYLIGKEDAAAMGKKALASHDPFELDTDWVRKYFPQNEFVVFIELLQHNEIPILSSNNLQDAPAELNLSARVRVFDLRGPAPRIVLQEVVEQEHHIPRQFTKANFNQVPWGDETFDVSPLGIAHDMLCKEISSRVEDYILIAGGSK